ncbi:MAG: RNA polymerase sigma factor [Gemmatimonadota bacterium]
MSRAGRSGSSDAEVVRAVLAGRQEEYELLVARYKDVLYRHALRMAGRPDEAADIVQQAFIKGFRNLRACRDPDRVGAWLFRIAANLSKDHLKSRRRRDLSLDAAGGAPELRQEAEAAAERSELREEIQRALQQLTDEQREAFVLKHVEGWSYEEMSEHLGVSVPALKMRVHRAREELQNLLSRYR